MVNRNPKRDPNLKYMGNYGDVTWKTYGGQFVLWNKLLNEIEVIGFEPFLKEEVGEGYPYKYEVYYASFTLPIEQTETRHIEDAKKVVGWVESEQSGRFHFKHPIDREIMLALAMISTWGYQDVIIKTNRIGEAISYIRGRGVPSSALRERSL